MHRRVILNTVVFENEHVILQRLVVPAGEW
jgi:hypothetical protein